MDKKKLKTDIEIAKSVQPLHISKIAENIGVSPEIIEQYGKYKAKLSLSLIDEAKIKKNKMILVTAISPTPAGEGKTTTSIGLADGLNKIGKKAGVALREPSLGPVFGIKGGAAGGGWAQVIPMEDINLHFTGDFAAIESANNLLAALIDNNIQSKNGNLQIDPRTVSWKRVLDVNDRSLRSIITGLGGSANGIPREAGFNITAASEVMAILCLSKDLDDLKTRLAKIYIGNTTFGEPVHCLDLHAQGAMTTLLKDAIMPNLVQTLEQTPAILHGGPFANIAQGTNSIIATKTAMSLFDYTITEAGFGADLGAEKFFHIKCSSAGISPNAVVIVATVRALKYHGGGTKDDFTKPNLRLMEAGFGNLEKHIENVKKYGVPIVVAINRFSGDADHEIDYIKQKCAVLDVVAETCTAFANGGEGAKELAAAVAKAADSFSGTFKPIYDKTDDVKTKIEKIAKEIYRSSSVEFQSKAISDLKKIEKLGLNHLPICIAKTPASFSDDPTVRGRADNLPLHIREIEIAAGAGFVVPITGTIMRMPGLPESPNAMKIDIDDNGNIYGLS